MPRTNYNVSRPSFIADHNSIDRDTGRQIDWANVPAGYVNADTGKKQLRPGTVVSESAANPGMVVPRAGLAGAPAVGLLETFAVEGDRNAAKTGYGVVIGGAVYEDLLPDAGDVAFGTMRTELEAAGTGFAFLTYADSRAI